MTSNGCPCRFTTPGICVPSPCTPSRVPAVMSSLVVDRTPIPDVTTAAFTANPSYVEVASLSVPAALAIRAIGASAQLTSEKLTDEGAVYLRLALYQTVLGLETLAAERVTFFKAPAASLPDAQNLSLSLNFRLDPNVTYRLTLEAQGISAAGGGTTAIGTDATLPLTNASLTALIFG